MSHLKLGRYLCGVIKFIFQSKIRLSFVRFRHKQDSKQGSFVVSRILHISFSLLKVSFVLYEANSIDIPNIAEDLFQKLKDEFTYRNETLLSLKHHKIYDTNKIDDFVFLYISQYKLLFAFEIGAFNICLIRALFQCAISPRKAVSSFLPTFESSRDA